MMKWKEDVELELTDLDRRGSGDGWDVPDDILLAGEERRMITATLIVAAALGYT